MNGIRQSAEAETLRALGRFINDLYLSESPSDTDDKETRKEKALRCEGIQMALEAISGKLKALE